MLGCALVVASLLIVSFPGFAAAQAAEGGSISGFITDSQGQRMRDVRVIAASAQSTSHAATSDEHGYYRIASLPPLDYTISAEAPGFASVSVERVAVREGLNLRLDLTMRVGPLRQSVTVAGQAPTIESKTATTAINISGDLLRAVPLSALRTWSDFLQLVPGVVTTQARFQTYTLLGTGPSSGVYRVDGADVTSVLQGSTLYSQFSEDAFQDIQVKTAAVDAAAPLGLGPVVSVATQSGTNQWLGTAGLALQPKSWNSDNAAGGQSLTVSTRQSDFSFGGPLRRDQWWFFGALRVARNETGVPRSAQQLTYLEGLAPGFAAFDNPWSGQFGFVKITGQLSRNTRMTGSFTRDVLTLGGAQANEVDQFRNVVTGGPSYFVRASSVWNQALTTSVSLGYNGKKQRNVNLQPDQAGVLVYQDVFHVGPLVFGSGLLGALTASPFPATDYRAHMWTIAADATYYLNGKSGSHEIQAGIYLQPDRRDQQVTTYNHSGFQLEEAVLRDRNNIAAGVIPFHRQVYDASHVTTTDVDSSDYAVYGQDAWRVASRLTLTAGLRLDLVKRIDQLFGATSQDSLEIGPRFGVNCLLTADERNAVRASWNRVHENLSVNETSVGARAAGSLDLFDTAGDGSFATQLGTPPLTSPSRDLVIDLDHYHQAHADEVMVGYQRQLPGQTTVDVSIMRREYRDRPAAVEINGIYQDNRFVGYHDPSQNEIYRLTANSWNWPVATALHVQAATRTHWLQMLASYSREWNHLAGTWQPNDPASIVQPTAFANAGGIGFVDGCTTGAFCADSNSLSGVPGGGAWRDHVAHAGISAEAPFNLQLAASYTFQSGPWSGPIYSILSDADPAVGPPVVTLSNGRIAPNPLTTPIRFAYTTRAQGQFTLPGLHLLNLRIARRFDVGASHLEAAADILNVTNHGADQVLQFGGNQQNSPFFGQGGARQFPRALQISARLLF